MKKFENLKSFENSLKGVQTAGELFELLRDAGAELWRAPLTALCKRSEEDVFLRYVGNGAYVDMPQIKFIRKRGVPNYLDYTPDESEVKNLRIHSYMFTDGYENSSSDKEEDDDISAISNDDDWEWESSLPYQDDRGDSFDDPDENFDSWERGYDY